MDNFLGLLLSAGGASFLTAIILGLKNVSSIKLESESALIQRLNEDAENAREESDKQRARAERAERFAELKRQELEKALDTAAEYRRMLISQGVSLKGENVE